MEHWPPQSTARWLIPFLPLLLSSCATTRATTDFVEPYDACQALRSPGFDEIMERALQRGLVKRFAPAVSSGPILAPGRLYAQAAPVMWAYQLTERAIEAGMPQRVGTVVAAGCTAAFVAIWHLVRRGPSTAERASTEQATRESTTPQASPSRPAREGPSPIPHVDMPERTDCTANVSRCLATPLGKRGSGRSPKHSICADCLEICQGQGEWPAWSHDGKDCQWWNH